MILSWEEAEVPPIPFVLTFDWGYRAFVNPDPGATELDLHRLLAWFVRNSGKKFTRNMRDDGSIFWWNSGQSDFEFGVAPVNALILLEKFGAGNCRIVEETKTVTVQAARLQRRSDGGRVIIKTAWKNFSRFVYPATEEYSTLQVREARRAFYAGFVEGALRGATPNDELEISKEYAAHLDEIERGEA